MIDKLNALIKEHTGKSNLSVTRETVLLSDLGMNSYELVSLVCVLEDEFDVEVPDRVIKTFKTVGDIIDFIEQQ